MLREHKNKSSSSFSRWLLIMKSLHWFRQCITGHLTRFFAMNWLQALIQCGMQWPQLFKLPQHPNPTTHKISAIHTTSLIPTRHSGFLQLLRLPELLWCTRPIPTQTIFSESYNEHNLKCYYTSVTPTGTLCDETTCNFYPNRLQAMIWVSLVISFF